MLSLLTLKESATTTVLSKRWKHLFSSLPHLTFDDYSFYYSFLESRDQQRYKKDDCRWFGNVCNVLGSRREPVKSCTIGVDYFDAYRDHLDDIIHLLSSGLENLTIKNWTLYSGVLCTIVPFPSSIFSCRGLTHLELFGCYLKVLNTFNGLWCLRDLKLKRCTGDDVDFEQLFSFCRAIESLVVENCYTVRDLVINAHKLIILKITTHRPLGIAITNAPGLESVKLHYHFNERYVYSLPEYDSGGIDYWDDATGKVDFQKFVSLFRSLRGIKNLSLDFDLDYLKRLTKDGLVLPKVLPFECRLNKLKKLTLRMQFDKGYAFSMVSCLLHSCPILEELAIGLSIMLGMNIHVEKLKSEITGRIRYLYTP